MPTIVDSLISPDADQTTLTDIIRQIDAGLIKLPDFQREFVWRERNVLDLLDSIARGFPIGSFLLWQVRERVLRSQRNIGGFVLPDTPENYPIDFVLDGQQRLTTSYALLKHGTITLGGRAVRVYFDLRTQEFVSDPDVVDRHLAPLDVLIDNQKSTRYLIGLNELEDSEQLISTYSSLQSLIMKYTVPITRIKQRDVRDVAQIFERINNTGQRLRLFDLMVALTYSPTFYLRDKIRNIIAELEDANFGNLDEGVFLQLMAAVTTGRTSRDAVIEMRDSSEKLEPVLEGLTKAAKKAVDLLKTGLFVFSDDLLPYERQFVALCYVYFKRGSINATEARVLERWFLQTSFSERYRRGGEGQFAEDLRSLLASTEGGALEERFKSETPAEVFQTNVFRKGTALSHAFASILARRRPRSIWDGNRIVLEDALSSFNRREFHHIFPRAYLARQGVDDSQISQLSNFCLLPSAHNKAIGEKPPSDYFAVLRGNLGATFDEIMNENFISAEAIAAAEANDYAAFTTMRARDLAVYVTSLTN